ncbi:MAG: hypothetical protein EXX96DRAFT_143253 [Benjaminiella poitrasii]|nr:MAG: hypothetical protein EXX96DRAFT_143253 [Benjaminiella poitrasii]
MTLLLLHFFILSCLFLFGANGDLISLRKHRYQIQPPIDEADILAASMIHNNQTSMSICGEASLSCMAFGSHQSSIPIRCGILSKVPLCERFDSKTQKLKCDTFCDTDGSGRLCLKAFQSCCSNSLNGCISSNPRTIVLYKKKVSQN